MMNRRSFLTSMLAVCAAPAIVRADSLMRIVPREALVLEAVTSDIGIFYGGARGGGKVLTLEMLRVARKKLEAAAIPMSDRWVVWDGKVFTKASA